MNKYDNVIQWAEETREELEKFLTGDYSIEALALILEVLYKIPGYEKLKLEYEAIAEMHINAVDCWRKAEVERDEWKRKCEAAVEDFVDYATSGTINHAPYCVNKTKLCTDARGWCNHDKNCKGFYPNSGAEQEEE